jgi:hypothetical protein
MLASKGIADAGLEWERACPGGTGMLASAMALAPTDRAKQIVATCKPDFLHAGELPSADTLPLAILLRPSMESNDEFDRRTVLRALAGL